MKVLMMMRSPNFLAMKSFYEELGVEWVEHKSNLYIHNVNSFFLALSPSDIGVFSRDLHFMPQTGEGMSFFDTKLLNTDLELFKDTNTDSSKSIIPILRSFDMEVAKEKYLSLGEWKKEKHGRGPEHYCLSEDGNALAEIYPVRKKNPVEDIELVFSGYYDFFDEDRGVGLTDPEENIITCLKTALL